MKLQIIIGSTRQGRISNHLGAWVKNEASKLEGVEAEVVDLVDYPMPLFDEAVAPQYNPQRQPVAEVQKWLDKLDEADAFILVTPEYNRSTSGVLKNALDQVAFQFAKKPVAIVAHGVNGGAQAVSHLRGIVPALQTVSVPTATFFSDRVADHIDEEGNLSDELSNKPYGPLMSIQSTLKDTVWYAQALKAARDSA